MRNVWTVQGQSVSEREDLQCYNRYRLVFLKSEMTVEVVLEIWLLVHADNEQARFPLSYGFINRSHQLLC